LKLTDQQLCARQLERHREPLMFLQRVLGRFAGRLHIASGRQQHGPTPRTNGEHPRAVEPIAVALKHIDDLLRVIEPAQSDHRLHRIRHKGRRDDLR
jgi:hypothetical protein